MTFLKLLSKYVNKAGLNQYFNLYILPLFDYGCLIWSRGSSTNNLRLLKHQKRAARIILNADILTPSKSIFKELQWLSFSKRVLYHKSVMMFKALNGMAPEYLSELFVKHHEFIADHYGLLITICSESLMQEQTISKTPFLSVGRNY